MTTADDRLIGIVGVQMQPTPAEDLRKNVAGRSHTLTGCAPDTNRERLPHRTFTQAGQPSFRASPPENFAQPDCTAHPKVRQVPPQKLAQVPIDSMPGLPRRRRRY